MKKRLPPLNWLRSFEVSARHLNFTQAASELNLTQAAISQQIKGLESQLGVLLFKRLPRGLELTKAGRAYVPVVHESIERLAEVTDELFGKGQTRPLTIKTNLIFFVTWLSSRLGQFRTLYPDVNLRFASNIWVEEMDKESDMEVRHGLGEWPDVKCDRLTWDELIPVCSPTLANGEMPPNSPEDLSRCTLLHVVGYNEGWGYWLKQTGFQALDSSQGIQFDTLISALNMAKRGQGIALGRTSVIEEMIETGQLIAPFEQRMATSEAFHLISPVNQFEHPHAEIFRSWLIKEAGIAREQVISSNI